MTVGVSLSGIVAPLGELDNIYLQHPGHLIEYCVTQETDQGSAFSGRIE